MFQQVVNNLYTYANRATIPPTTLSKPQQDDLEHEQIKKTSWVQETAYKIALKQKKLLEEPIKDTDRNLLGNLTNATHWLKAGQPGKLVAAVEYVSKMHGPLRFSCDGPDNTGLTWVAFYKPQRYEIWGKSHDLAYVFWIEPTDDLTETPSRQLAMKQKFGRLAKELDIQSAIDNDLERNIQSRSRTTSSNQVILGQKIKDHLRKLDLRAGREEAGSKIIVADREDRDQASIKSREIRVEKCGLGGDDWLFIGTTTSERARARKKAG